MNKTSNKIIIVMFLGILLFLSISFFVKRDMEFSENENRYLAQNPDFSFVTALDGSYERSLRSYIDDQFPFRESFIKSRNSLARVFGNEVIGGLYVCKNKALTENITQWEFDKSRYEDNLQEIKAFYDNLSLKIDPARLSTILVPTSALALEKQLPYGAAMFNQEEAIKKADELLKSYNNIDLDKQFWKDKESYGYYALDHHWTTAGAKSAYEKWQNIKVETTLEKVNDEFKGSYYSKVLLDYGLSDSIYLYKEVSNNKVLIDGKKAKMYDMKQLKTKDKYNVFFGGNFAEIKVEGNPYDQRTLLVVKDSYANSFVPFVAKQFKKIIVIDLRYFKGDVQSLVKENAVSDVLTLYGINTLMNDNNLKKLNKKLIGAI